MQSKSPKRMTQPEMQRATEEIVRELGVNINAAINNYFPGSQFALIVFLVNNPKVSNYISNAKRETMIKVLKELTRKLDADEDAPTIRSAQNFVKETIH